MRLSGHTGSAVEVCSSQGMQGQQLQRAVHDINFPGGSHGKASVYNVGDPGAIPGSGRTPSVESCGCGLGPSPVRLG